MANAKICDKCGQVFRYEKDAFERRYFIRKDLRYNDEYVDLCPKCYAELVIFLEEDNP